jgi:hypothetical protein
MLDCIVYKHNGIPPTTKVVGILPVRIVISIPADVSCDTVNADNVGYTWVKEGNAVERKSETVVNMQRFIKNIETSNDERAPLSTPQVK